MMISCTMVQKNEHNSFFTFTAPLGLYFFDLVLAGGRDRGQNVRGQGNDSGLGAFREICSVQLSAMVA